MESTNTINSWTIIKEYKKIDDQDSDDTSGDFQDINIDAVENNNVIVKNNNHNDNQDNDKNIYHNINQNIV